MSGIVNENRFCVQCGERREPPRRGKQVRQKNGAKAHLPSHTRCGDCASLPETAHVARFDGATGNRLDGQPSSVHRSLVASGLGAFLDAYS